jgi:ArsR family transcriptional regulator
MALDCVEFCKTLGDETRQRILRMLADEGEMNVSDIVAAFEVSQPTISHHLNILRQFGLVASRKEGKQVFYTLNRDRVTECCGRLIALLDVQEEVCEI